MYLIKGQCLEHKIHLNQLKMRYTGERRIMPMEVFYDTFEVPVLRDIKLRRTNFIKQKPTEYLEVIHKQKIH